MKNAVAISIGVAMMLAALFIASTSTSQGITSQSQAARGFATALHTSPTPPPTPSLTPAPTVTPIAGWSKLTADGIELWLPPNYDQLKLSKRVTNRRYLTRGGIDGDVVVYAYDALMGLSLTVRDVSVIRVQTTLNPREVPFGIEAQDGAFETPTPVALGPYAALRSVANGPGIADVPVRIKNLVYWIKHGDYYWVLIYTSPDYDFDQNLPAFERSARSFRIRSDE
jgi:hypothetical protein